MKPLIIFSLIAALTVALFTSEIFGQTNSISGSTMMQTQILEKKEQGDRQESEINKYPTAKGSTLIGGLASFSVTNVSGSTLTSLTVVPNAIFFLSSGIGLGFDMSFSWASAEKSSATSIAIGPKFMLAFGKAETNTYPYLGFGLNYLSMSRTYESYSWYSSITTKTVSTSGNIIKIGFGLMLKIGENLVLPVEFGVVITNVESEQMTVYGLGIGLAGILY